MAISHKASGEGLEPRLSIYICLEIESSLHDRIRRYRSTLQLSLVWDSLMTECIIRLDSIEMGRSTL